MKAVVFALALLWSAPVLAQETAHTASELAIAGRLVDAMGGVEAAKVGMAAIGPHVLAGYADQGLTPEMGAALVDELGKEFDLHKAEFRAAMAGVYAKHFTESELRDQLRFMESPSGRAWVAKMGPLMVDAGAVGEALAAKVTAPAIARVIARYAPKPRT